MGNCKDCRFWGWGIDDEPDSPTRECRLFSDFPYYPPNVAPDEQRPQPLATASPWAGAQGAGFDTQGAFGCVQFEPREG